MSTWVPSRGTSKRRRLCFACYVGMRTTRWCSATCWSTRRCWAVSNETEAVAPHRSSSIGGEALVQFMLVPDPLRGRSSAVSPRHVSPLLDRLTHRSSRWPVTRAQVIRHYPSREQGRLSEEHLVSPRLRWPATVGLARSRCPRWAQHRRADRKLAGASWHRDVRSDASRFGGSVVVGDQGRRPSRTAVELPIARTGWLG